MDGKRRGFFLLVDSLAHAKASAQSLDVGMSWAKAAGMPMNRLKEIQDTLDVLICDLALELSGHR